MPILLFQVINILNGMNIKLYKSSTIGLNLSGYKILMDPWLTDGEYYGSWSHYPYYDLDKNINEINSYNAIYISHIHPDHCSDDTLKKISKEIPIYIQKSFLNLSSVLILFFDFIETSLRFFKKSYWEI